VNSSNERQSIPKYSFYRTKENIRSLNDKDPGTVGNSTGSNAKSVLGKGKSKDHPRTDHEAQRGSRGIALLFL